MSQTDSGSRGHSAPDDEPQDSRETDTVECQAIAVSTSQRCERDALAGVAYCPLHLDRVDEDFTG
ncbi:hypothetical protein NDI54_05935 [Haloarcula sp. S1AR25-5A]|uniref:Uncharacterized protein n=1 Tax=Haloarcula terrestris TaxID=2950533 RepID=A0AAE4JHY8_9EURY|nr:hypothetical protein [Haloarcula terrestris]MDS0220894.1 hypothetical protein [Haloarcula terrestris]